MKIKLLFGEDNKEEKENRSGGKRMVKEDCLRYLNKRVRVTYTSKAIKAESSQVGVIKATLKAFLVLDVSDEKEIIIKYDQIKSIRIV